MVFKQIMDPEWERIGSDPGNRWYRKGEEYRNLFATSRVKETAPERARAGSASGQHSTAAFMPEEKRAEEGAGLLR